MILLSIDYSINGRILELEAAEVILPGMLLQRLVNGRVVPHSIENGTAYPLISCENRLAGRSIEHAYEVGEVVFCRYCLPGDVFMGLVDSSQFDIKIGDFLSSDGTGFFHKIPTNELYNSVIVGNALASPGSQDIYEYFAINGIALEEIYMQAQEFFYAVGNYQITLENFIPIEVA